MTLLVFFVTLMVFFVTLILPLFFQEGGWSNMKEKYKRYRPTSATAVFGRPSSAGLLRPRPASAKAGFGQSRLRPRPSSAGRLRPTAFGRPSSAKDGFGQGRLRPRTASAGTASASHLRPRTLRPRTASAKDGFGRRRLRPGRLRPGVFGQTVTHSWGPGYKP